MRNSRRARTSIFRNNSQILINDWHFTNLLIFTRFNSSLQVTPHSEIFRCVTRFYSLNLSILPKDKVTSTPSANDSALIIYCYQNIFALTLLAMNLSLNYLQPYNYRQIKLRLHILPIIKIFSLILIKTEIET